jgi:hypothetical protein
MMQTPTANEVSGCVRDLLDAHSRSPHDPAAGGRREQLAASLGLVLVLVPAVLALIHEARAQQRPTVEILVRTASPPPGLTDSLVEALVNDGSGTFSVRPRISESGLIIFEASVREDPFSPARRGLWTMGFAGEASRLAEVGQRAHQTPDACEYAGFGSAQVSPAGRVVFDAALTGGSVIPGVSDLGVWLHDGSATIAAFRRGDPAPGSSGSGFYRTLFSPNVADEPAGSIVVQAAMVGSLPGGSPTVPSAAGTWLSDGQTQTMVHWSGLHPPGLPFASFVYHFSLVSTARWVVFGGRFSGLGVPTVYVESVPIETDRAIWHANGASTVLLARTGMQAPGLDPAVVFRALPVTASSQPAIGPSGHAAFSCQLIGPGVDLSNDTALYTSTAGVPSLRARAGQPAPGMSPGIVYSTVSSNSVNHTLAVAQDGGVAFLSNIAGPGVTLSDYRCLWHATEVHTSLIARSGTPQPGLPSGVVIAPAFVIRSLQCAAGGRGAFIAQLSGTGVNSSNDYALFAFGPAGTRAAAREGDVIGPLRLTNINLASPDLQVSEGGYIVLTANVAAVGDPFQVEREAIVSVSPDGQVAVVAAVQWPISTRSGATPPVSMLRMARSGAMDSSGRLVFAAAFQGTQSDQAILVHRWAPPCPQDHDQSGALDVADIFAFLADWFAGEADFDGNGETEVGDIFAFLAAWFAGCPA